MESVLGSANLIKVGNLSVYFVSRVFYSVYYVTQFDRIIGLYHAWP